MNNLFSYSPKELTTDGFLTWLICEVESEPKWMKALFFRLGLCSNNSKIISNVKITRQEKNTDLIIRYDVDSSPHQALFENKTYSTIHSDQLARYRDQFPGFKHYKYLKLARVNYNERRLAKKYGYDVLTSYDLFDAINLIGLESEILAQYKQFLLNHFIEPINQIESVLVSENKYDLFSDIQAQQYLIDLLYEKIDGLNDALYFKSSSNLGGSPWTQLDICKREHAYSNISEYLFWRIDKRSGSYYLRLNQYARVDSIDERRKFENLELLREVIKPLFKNHGLCVSDPSDRGVKESEVCIVFFKDNNLKTIREVPADLTLEIVEKYWNIDFQ